MMFSGKRRLYRIWSIKVAHVCCLYSLPVRCVLSHLDPGAAWPLPTHHEAGMCCDWSLRAHCRGVASASVDSISSDPVSCHSIFRARPTCL